MQDFTKDLTIAFAGTGDSAFNNVDALLGDYIFGPMPEEGEEEIEREVTILIPIEYKDAPGIRTLRSWGEPLGVVFDIVKGDDPHSTLDNVFGVLENAQANDQETAFIMFYNPESKYEKDNPALTDLEVISEAKNHPWLTTLDVCQGLVDFFEGYESTDDRIKREALEEAFAEQQKAKEAAEKPAKAPRKTAAKKATTPRKRAAAKQVEMEEEPLPMEPEKPLAEPSCACDGQTLLQIHRSVADGGCYDPELAVGDTVEVDGLHFTKIADDPFPDPKKSGLDKLVDDAVKREQEKKAARSAPKSLEEFEQGVLSGEIGGPVVTTELSGTIVVGAPKLPEGLSPVTTADIWQDVAKAVPADTTHFMVTKEDIVELGEAMEEMANAFGKAIRVYKNIVEGK